MMVDKIEAPDPHTVVIHLKFATSAFLPALANPYNWIYQKKVLDKDPHWYEKNIMGSGPFKFAGYEVGQLIKGVRNPDYYHKGLPYLDGFVGIYAPKQAVQLDAIRADRAATEFRGYPPSAIDQLKQELGDKIVVQQQRLELRRWCWFNHKKKPFDDVRVRRALTLALDRWGSAPGPLQDQPRCRPSAASSFPGSPLAPNKEQLEQHRRVLARHREVAGRGAPAAEGGGRRRPHLRDGEPQRRSALQISRHLADRSMEQDRPARHTEGGADRSVVRRVAQRRFWRLDRRQLPRHRQPGDRCPNLAAALGQPVRITATTRIRRSSISTRRCCTRPISRSSAR